MGKRYFRSFPVAQTLYQQKLGTTSDRQIRHDVLTQVCERCNWDMHTWRQIESSHQDIETAPGNLSAAMTVPGGRVLIPDLPEHAAQCELVCCQSCGMGALVSGKCPPPCTTAVAAISPSAAICDLPLAKCG